MTVTEQQQRRPRVFLTSTMQGTFIQEDIETLRRHFDLDVFIGSGIGAVADVVRRAWRADVSFSWFGSVYSFFMVAAARLRRRRSVIMIGGVDAARNRELGYGVWTSRWKSVLLSYAIRNADRVFVVDTSLKNALIALTGWSGDTIERLPTGYDPVAWRPAFPKERFVLCVANCDSERRMKVKGIDLLLEVAQRTPGVRFVIVGFDPVLAGRTPAAHLPNVELVHSVPRETLLSYYQRAKVYCQASRHEGLPNALCEAMLCACIPVGADVGGVRTAIAENGFIVPAEDIEALRETILHAMSLPEIGGVRGRRHIARSFPKSEREAKLVDAIRRLANA